MDPIQYRMQQQSGGSNDSILVIWTSKMRHALELKISQKTVWNHLHKAGLKKKLDVWVLHELTQKNLLDRIHACDSLLKRNAIDPFLKRMVTSDEKWVTYENNRRKRSWSKRGEPVPDDRQARINCQEGFTVCLVGLEGNHPL
ncbi:histone-lysine N-methyltransferase SETMAR-like [Harpegnathos saltator]|uniref:histone-lysine N-methyltransferase SETMAR-like n=1 Tax=Harpegnathos saltator TaxID=610380 RepID=UPI000DBEDC62|nr:histone-lysine N-methyltransferase SETMAR-like [Harpegnathos saltator]